MTLWIVAVLGLYFVQIFFAAAFHTVLAPNAGEAVKDHMQGKDHDPKTSVMGGRADRALNNLKESLPFFLAFALLLQIQGDTEGLAETGALVYFVGRVLYVPAYLSAIMGVRTLMWAVSLVGLGMMLTAVLS